MSFLRPPMRADVALRVAGLAATASALALVAACAPDLGHLAQIKPAAGYAAQKTLGAPTTTAWPSETWWTAYNDPQLNALIEEALKGAPDLKVAEARLREAQAQTQVSGAPLLPSISGSGSVQGTGIELNFKGIPSNFKDFLPSTIQPFTNLGGKFA